MQQKHWVFDLDGTLVDSFSHYFNFLAEVFERHGLAFKDELRLPAITHHLPTFFETHLGPQAVQAALDELQSRSNDDAQRISPFSGAKELVSKLREQGDRIAVWTNRDLTSATLILQSTGLDRYVELCVSGTCTAERKPHPEGLLKIMNTFGARPENVVMIGDHEYDVQAGRSAGVTAIRASWHSYWDVATCGVSHRQFYSFREFSEWVSQNWHMPISNN